MKTNVYKKLLAPAVLGLGLLVSVSPSFAYTVKKGDTMSEIAENNSLSLNELASLNPQVRNVNLIHVGDNIKTNKNNVTSVSTKTGTVNASAYEKDLLARLIEAEAGNEPYEGKVAVGYVVLNRVVSPDFPNSITEVINQPRQFTPVSDGRINNKPSADSIKAMNEALNADTSKGAGSLFFYNPKTATSRWLDGKPTTVVIGNHVFKK